MYERFAIVNLCGMFLFRPKFSVVIVKKRISARLFHKGSDGSNLTNPPPGTVVDTDITRKQWYEQFFLPLRAGTVLFG